jgi:hypothetical protein
MKNNSAAVIAVAETAAVVVPMEAFVTGGFV